MDPTKVALRDRKFSKAELSQLEKKTWIEIKDLIFETEPSVLEYLSYHCKRFRMTSSNQLAEEIKKIKVSGRKQKEFNSLGSTMRSVSQPPAANINLGQSLKKVLAGAIGRLPGNGSPDI